MSLIFIFTFATPWVSDLKVAIGQPVGEAIWKIGEDPSKDIYDAVIVEDLTEFTTLSINRYRKIRILSENGKAAAEFIDFTGETEKLTGRVVDVSGEETVFDRKEDFVEVLGLKSKNRTIKSKILVPPGLTADCLVELSWKIPSLEGLPRGSNRQRFPVQEDYFCRVKVFKLNNNALRSRGSFFVTRAIWSTLKPPAQFAEEKTRSGRTLTYSNIPAQQDHPFGNENLDDNSGFVLIYKTFPDFGKEPGRFWKKLGKEYLGNIWFADKFGKGSDYKRWIRQLKQSLPEDPAQSALHIYHAFRQRVASTDMMPPEVKARYAVKGPVDSENNHYLEQVFDYGYGEPWQLGFLFYKVARDCELPVQVLFTSSIYDAPFRMDALDPFSLELYFPLFGIPTINGQRLLLAPAFPEYDAGYVPYYLQGGQAIAYSPGEKWSHSPTRIPRLGPNSHQLIRRYQINVTADGEMNFSVVQKGSGVFNARQRELFYPLPEEERVTRLKKSWQNRLGSWKVTNAMLRNVDNLAEPVETVVQGEDTLEIEDEQWVALSPFPGDSLPLSRPRIWPANRRQPIILPHTANQIDLSKITLPKGWKLRGNGDWQKQNSVGKVSYRAIQKGNVLTVRRDIVIAQDLMPAEKERELKYFIAWMDEAFYQTIAITHGEVH